MNNSINISQAVRLRIRGLCDERKITINKLSDMSGVTQSTVQNFMMGKNKSTQVDTLKKLCDGFDITIIEFFNDDLFRNLEQEIK